MIKSESHIYTNINIYHKKSQYNTHIPSQLVKNA